MISAYPKIFTLGTRYIKDIFDGPVEISEKIDGSQFVAGRVNGEVYMRSKGAPLYFQNTNKMFDLAVEYINSIQDKLPENMVFYFEYLQRPKHNALVYNRVPKNNLMLWGVMSKDGTSHQELDLWAKELGVECVPIIQVGEVGWNKEKFDELLNRESVLGGQKIEGFVVKNYTKQFLIGGQKIPLMAGKYVSEQFKEVARGSWKKDHTPKGRFEEFKESFCTEARWNKAIQHLRDSGKLEVAPSDIGALIKEVYRDIEEEERETIKNFLYSEFKGDILRTATRGLPEFYKQKLATGELE